VAGRGDDVKAVALEVVVWVGDGAELVLATVARAGVDVTDCEPTGIAAGQSFATPDRYELS
jgi:hypothetical protein